MKKSTRLITALSGLCLITTFFFPIWMILLEAPQFPEGLSMYIWADKLTGNVDTINGLNHYIGMQKISEASFPELIYLPILMGFFLVFGVITALLKRKTILYIYSSLLIVFALAALTDFYLWEYSYGHDLDPKAPIKLDNMSFQPPLLGYKQIANFLAGSFPAAGGVFFMLSVALSVVASVMELRNKSNKNNKINPHKQVPAMNLAVVLIIFLVTACTPGSVTPQPINFGHDECDHCRMTISDKKYGAEIVTAKGKAYKFDDIGCMIGFEKEFTKNHPGEKTHRFVINFYSPEGFVAAENAHILKGSSLRTPMASGLAAFGGQEDVKKAQKEFGGEIIKGTELK